MIGGAVVGEAPAVLLVAEHLWQVDRCDYQLHPRHRLLVPLAAVALQREEVLGPIVSCLLCQGLLAIYMVRAEMTQR